MQQLSAARCRQLLPGDRYYTEAEVEELRDHLYHLADVVVSLYESRRPDRNESEWVEGSAEQPETPLQARTH